MVSLGVGISNLFDESSASKTTFSDKTLDFGSLLSLLTVLGNPGSSDDVLLDKSNTVGFLVTI